mmetsp:Transcript_83250/g.231003  ORF Transcript_83250/g.231003 Transcript_83250/m.231003 type:complete len:204 (+) Transcript_83250:284-895(+)
MREGEASTIAGAGLGPGARLLRSEARAAKRLPAPAALPTGPGQRESLQGAQRLWHCDAAEHGRDGGARDLGRGRRTMGPGAERDCRAKGLRRPARRACGQRRELAELLDAGQCPRDAAPRGRAGLGAQRDAPRGAAARSGSGPPLPGAVRGPRPGAAAAGGHRGRPRTCIRRRREHRRLRALALWGAWRRSQLCGGGARPNRC